MKLVTAAVVAASLAFAPLPSQAFFNEETRDYFGHIADCVGLLFSERHAEVCGGTVVGPFNSLSSPGSPNGPAPVEEEGEDKCEMLGYVKGLAPGDRVRVALDPCP